MKPFTLLLVFASVIFISCGEKKSVSVDEDPISKFQAQQIASLNRQINLYQKQRSDRALHSLDLDAGNQSLIERRFKLTELRRAKTAAEKDLQESRVKFADHREQVKVAVRMAARGEKLGMLTVPGGRTYYDVQIKEVSDVGLVVTHKAGRARIPFMHLSAEHQERFFYDVKLAKLTRAEEFRSAQKHEQALALRRRDQIAKETNKRQEEIAEAMRPVADNHIPIYSPTDSPDSDTGPVSTWRERRSARRARRSSRNYYYNSRNQSSNYSCPVPTTRTYTRVFTPRFFTPGR